MTGRDILVPAAVMALLRREETVRGVAERLGVTEAQVLEWTDIFVIGGVLALTEFRSGRLHSAPTARQYGSKLSQKTSTSFAPEGTTGEFDRTTSIAAFVPTTQSPIECQGDVQ
jgi:hypothetical protein